MRSKRKHLVVGTLALTVSVAMAGSAQAVLSGQTLTTVVAPAKQQFKKFRAVKRIRVGVDTQYSGANFTPKAVNTKVHFDRHFRFFAGRLPRCAPASLANTTTEQANARCGAARVGFGTSFVTNGAQGAQGLVTAYNGTPVGGRQQLLLHNRIGPPLNATSVLSGVLRPSDQGRLYGWMLDVTVPILPLGFVITHFDTTVPKRLTKPKNKKKNKPARFFVENRCRDRNRQWDFLAVTTYNTGFQTFAPAQQSCKVPKKKR